MTGRGFLKSRLAQIAKNSEEVPKPEIPPQIPEERSNLEESSKSPDSCVSKVSAPITNIPTLFSGPPQVRGRRVIIFVDNLVKIFFYFYVKLNYKVHFFNE
jgi:hypothetical protein